MAVRPPTNNENWSTLSLEGRGGVFGVIFYTMKKNDRYLQVAIAAAKAAGQIQKLHFGQSHRVEYKGDINPVTEVDRLCERTIVQIILDVFPDHDLLTEE